MFLDDLNTNMEFDIDPVTISKERIATFAKLYDPLPLHCDEDYAKKTRFGKLIASGMMSYMAVWASFVEGKDNYLGDELVAGKSTKVEWYKPVFAGDTLTGRARVTDIIRRNAHNGIARLRIDAYNQHGELVLTGVTESILKYRESTHQA